MNFKWLKQYMPRSLYGRAALILLVPIVTIQLVVSIVFIQRLYEGVTRQMTTNVLLELRYLVGEVNKAADPVAANKAIQPLLKRLDMRVDLPARDPVPERRLFYDLSGRIVIATIKKGLPGTRSVDLVASSREVHVLVASRHGDMEVIIPRRRVSASNPHQLLVLMVFTSILMTIIAFLFLRNQLRPIKRLAAASEAFGKGQVIRYHPSGATEVRAAGTSFLAMRARIERQIEQRTMMLSGVSHDLRTPLTRLRLGLSMLENCPETEELIHDVEEMEKLIDGFLDFARGQAGDDLSAADPVVLAEDVVKGAARGGGNVCLRKVHGDIPDSGLIVNMRPTAIRRALENLIGNALRYGARAELSLSVQERTIRYTVEDDGPGIPPEDREEALKPFSRLEPARNQDKGSGVGLGLSIAADIARAHGGSLHLGKSTRLGGLRVDLVLMR